MANYSGHALSSRLGTCAQLSTRDLRSALDPVYRDRAKAGLIRIPTARTADDTQSSAKTADYTRRPLTIRKAARRRNSDPGVLLRPSEQWCASALTGRPALRDSGWWCFGIPDDGASGFRMVVLRDSGWWCFAGVQAVGARASSKPSPAR